MKNVKNTEGKGVAWPFFLKKKKWFQENSLDTLTCGCVEGDI